MHDYVVSLQFIYCCVSVISNSMDLFGRMQKNVTMVKYALNCT